VVTGLIAGTSLVRTVDTQTLPRLLARQPGAGQYLDHRRGAAVRAIIK